MGVRDGIKTEVTFAGTYERDPKCCSKDSLVSIPAMLLMAKSCSSGKYLKTALYSKITVPLYYVTDYIPIPTVNITNAGMASRLV